MAPFKRRESKRGRLSKMSKNIERLYKEGKIRECKVVVTPMDFVRVLGKHTRVRIKYETYTYNSPKTKKNKKISPPRPNSRLKNKENGMVQIQRKTYKQHPVKQLKNTNKLKNIDLITESLPIQPSKQVQQKTNIISKESSGKESKQKINNVSKESKGKDSKQKTNKVSKESNILKETTVVSDNLIKPFVVKPKYYHIVFTKPKVNNTCDLKNKISLRELLPSIEKSILPSEEWSIDYFPKNEEPKDDKVYDRIAAELEVLMYNEKPADNHTKSDLPETKVDEFPSIMEILNDSAADYPPKPNETNLPQINTSLESSDVEAMLLGKPNVDKVLKTIPDNVDNTNVGELIEDMSQLNSMTNGSKSKNDDGKEMKPNTEELKSADENAPQSSSILDETLQKGIEEQLANDQQKEGSSDVQVVQCPEYPNSETSYNNEINSTEIVINVSLPFNERNINNNNLFNNDNITHVVFKKIVSEKCLKSLTCYKNLNYSIELKDKTVNFLGAPKYVSSLEDLKVLLQIIDESDLESFYVEY